MLERASQEASPDKKKRCERMRDWPEAWRLENEAWSSEPEKLKRRQLWFRWEEALRNRVFAVASTARRQELREWKKEHQDFIARTQHQLVDLV